MDEEAFTSAEPEPDPDTEPTSPVAPTPSSPPPAGPHPVVQAMRDPDIRQGAGVQLLWVGISAVTGAALLGPWGVPAAMGIAGAVRNALRARKLYQHPHPGYRREAGRNVTLAVVGLGAAAVGIYNALDRRKDDDK